MQSNTTPTLSNRRQFYLSFIVIIAAIAVSIVTKNIYALADLGGFISHLFKVLAGVIIGGYILFGGRILLKIGGKLPFAATIATSIAAATSLGTFIPQNMHIGVLEPATTSLSKTLLFFELNDIFHSWWYVSLFILLIISLVLVTKRKAFNRRNIGFHLTHISLIVIVICIWTDFFWGYRGMLHLERGIPTSTMELHFRNSGKTIGHKTLPFSVELQKFETEKHDADFNIQLWKKNLSEDFIAGRDTNPKADPKPIASYDILEGVSNKIWGTELEFKLDNFYPDARFRKELKSVVTNRGATAPVVYGTVSAEGVSRNIRLAVNDRSNIMKAPFGSAELLFVWQRSEADKLLQRKKNASPHVLNIKSSIGNETFPLTEGSKFTISNSADITVEYIFKNLQFNRQTNSMEEGEPSGTNPAVRFKCIMPDTAFTFVLLPGMNDHISKKAKYIESTLDISLLYTVAPETIYVLVGETNELFTKTNDSISKDSLILGEAYFFNEWNKIQFTFNHIFEDDSQVATVPYSASDSLLNPMGEIVVLNGADTLNTGYIPRFDGSYKTVYDLSGTEFFLTLESLESKETKFWKSELSIKDSTGNEAMKGEVSVNHPLSYGGYRFYQTDFDPNRPEYSGIGITHEPALKVLYAAFYTLIAGVIMMFYFRPAKPKEDINL